MPSAPMWQRFALSLFVAAALVVAMVLYVNGHNTDSPTSTNPAAAVQANRDAEILIAQDQAPHSGSLVRGQSPAAGLERSVHAQMAAQIKAGSIDGPLHRARCHPVKSTPGPRQAFSCSIVAAGVTYPFLGVVDTTERRITYCKLDQPPVASHDIPVSAGCRA
ncbi:MAG: hypothetical protein ACRDRD_21675 [Pseudonocardiaceae bacterium]